MRGTNNFGNGMNDAVITALMATATTAIGAVVTYGLKKASEAFANRKGGK